MLDEKKPESPFSGALYEEVSRPMKVRERLEEELSRAVNEAYGLTAEEVVLLWDTAPPRMPGKSAG